MGLQALAGPAGAVPFAKGGVLGVGAREAGQGGAVVARQADADALWWNPAGLDADPGFDMGMGYGDGLSQGLFDTAFAHRGVIPGLGAAYGVGARHVGSAPALDQDEYALAVAFPFSDDGRLLAGFAARALKARVGLVSADGYGVDLGLRYQVPAFRDRLTLGLAARDLQAALNWPAGPPDNPAQLFQAGAAWALGPDSSLEVDAEASDAPSHPGEVTEGFKVGGERWWSWPAYGLKRFVALRLGYLQNSGQDPVALGGQFSAGLGLHWRGWRIDYSWSQGLAGLGPVQRVGLAVDLAPAVAASPPPRDEPRVATPAAAVKPSLALTLSLSSFDPSQDPEGLLIRVQATGLSAAARSRFEILDPQGGSVAVKDTVAPAESYAWDGQRPGQGPAAPGVYGARLRAWDAAGTTLAGTTAMFQLLAGVGALALTPEDTVFAPLAQSSRPQLRLAVDYGGTDAKRWTLIVAKAGEPRPLRVLSGAGLPAVMAWNGLDRAGQRASDGPYDLTLDVLRANGATVTAKAAVTVDTRRPGVDLAAQPRVFSPAGDLAGVTFKPALSGGPVPAHWTLQVQTLNGSTLRGFEGVGAPPASLAWNGLDQQGQPVPPGTLCYADLMVEMASGAQARQPRLALSSRLAEPKLPFRVPLTTVRFAPGDEVVGLDDYKALKEAAVALKQAAKDYVLQVLGRAAPGESGQHGLGDLELSYLRAQAVRDYLVDSEGLDPARVQVCGLGAEEKAAPGEGGDRSRRVDVVLYTQ